MMKNSVGLEKKLFWNYNNSVETTLGKDIIFMIKVCVFDLDGTVMDTLSSIAYFVNYTLGKLGFESIEKDEFKYMAGSGRSVLLHRALAFRGVDTEDNFLKACKIYDSAYEGNFMYLTKPFDGIIDAITKIKEKGVKIAVLSNKPDNVTRLVVEDVFGKGFFDHIQGQTEDVPMKPNPTGFLKICQKYGAAPDEACMVGDTNIDIGTGVNAKTFTIGVLWGFRTEKELLDAGADKIVSTPEELADFVAKRA